jgi:hypothetical protein
MKGLSYVFVTHDLTEYWSFIFGGSKPILEHGCIDHRNHCQLVINYLYFF